MQFELTEDQHLLQQTVRKFARETLLPVAAELDEEGKFPKAQVARMAELGLMGIMAPVEYGGAGMDPVCYAVAMEEISAGCASCGVIMSVNNSLVVDPILKYGTEAQKRAYLPDLTSGRTLGCFGLSEPGTGSDAAAQTTIAEKKGDRWIINGSKNWITNGKEADVFLMMAMGDKSKGVKGINAYIIPMNTPGLTVAKNEKKLGIKASSTTQVILENVSLSLDALLGKEGDGFKIAMGSLDGGRIGIASQALGIARQAFEEARDYAKERHAFGAPIANFQAIQFKLADMAMEIDAARLLIWRAAALKGAGQKFGPQAAMAKLFASEMATRVTHQAIQIFGGFGYSKEYPAERHYRDARITEIYEGTSEIQRLVIGRHALTS